MILNFGSTVPVKVASNLADIKLHILVNTTSGTVYIAHTREELENTFGATGGYALDNDDGALELQWTGDVWMRCSAADMQVSFDTETAGNIRVGSRKVLPVTQATDTSSSGNVVRAAHHGQQQRP